MPFMFLHKLRYRTNCCKDPPKSSSSLGFRDIPFLWCSIFVAARKNIALSICNMVFRIPKIHFIDVCLNKSPSNNTQTALKRQNLFEQMMVSLYIISRESIVVGQGVTEKWNSIFTFSNLNKQLLILILRSLLQFLTSTFSTNS